MDMLLQGKGEIVFAAACLSIISKSIEDLCLIENHWVSVELYQKSMEVSHMRAFQNFLSQYCKDDTFLKNGFDVMTGMAGLSVGSIPVLIGVALLMVMTTLGIPTKAVVSPKDSQRPGVYGCGCRLLSMVILGWGYETQNRRVFGMQ
ncbi:MAG: hypothetical protein H7829_01830 [Magnetococcus sp. THC-1_WYH]